MQTDDTMIPKPCLSEYIKQVSKGTIKRNNLPFEFTIKFECSQKDKAELLLRALSGYKHRYYVEKKDKYYIHFWEKADGMVGLDLMKEGNPGYDFVGEEHIIEREVEDEVD